MTAAESLLPFTFDAVTFSAGGRVILDRVSAEIAAGPRTVILGPNGAQPLKSSHGSGLNGTDEK